MAVRIGSARSSFGNTKAGDQNGGKEVSRQDWYLHSKGWVLIRPKDADVADRIARAMELACDNNDIGYSQPTRDTLYNDIKDRGFDPSRTSKPVNTDCSALVRVCVNYAGIRVGNFITSNETSVLNATGAFEIITDAKHCKSADYLKRGDILNTRTKGHTVVVLSNGAKAKPNDPIKPVPALGDRLLRNGCEGKDVAELQGALIQLGYDLGKWGADGDFGDATEMAVRQLQTDYGIEVDGIVGAETIAAINRALEADGEVLQTARAVEIVGGNCYVRNEASVNGAILGVAYEGSKYVYRNRQSYNGWLLIEFGGRDGWVSGKYGKLVMG